MEEINVSSSNDEKVVKPMSDSKNSSSKVKFSTKTLAVFVVLVGLGLATGYGLYAQKTAGTVRLAGRDVEVVKTELEEGVKDASTFRDTATGMVEENDGKITDEGTHILVRGDASQNVYMTSSVIDLSKYDGKKAQVWGETFQGQKAGWLMDVGRIKIIE